MFTSLSDRFGYIPRANRADGVGFSFYIELGLRVSTDRGCSGAGFVESGFLDPKPFVGEVSSQATYTVMATGSLGCKGLGFRTARPH